MRRACVVWFLLAAPLWAAPKIVGPTQVEPYRIVDLSADGAGPDDLVFWDIDQEDRADVRERGSTFSFTGPPGTYRVKVRVIPVKDGKISGPAVTSRAVVVIGAAPPPPGPDPQPPVPADVKALADALRPLHASAAGTPAERERWRAALASLYREAVGYAERPEDRTVGELLARVKTASGRLLPADALRPVRERLAQEWAAALPSAPDAPLDAAAQQKAAALFRRISQSLDLLRAP